VIPSLVSALEVVVDIPDPPLQVLPAQDQPTDVAHIRIRQEDQSSDSLDEVQLVLGQLTLALESHAVSLGTVIRRLSRKPQLRFRNNGGIEHHQDRGALAGKFVVWGPVNGHYLLIATIAGQTY
jgi:hypothetical protein